MKPSSIKQKARAKKGRVRKQSNPRAKRTKTSLIESPEWQEAIFEGSRDAIFVADALDRFVAVNNAACTLTGYAREELLKKRIADLHDEEDLAAYNQFRNRIMSGEPILSEARLKRKDGIKVDTEFSNSRVIIAGISYMHTSARDITERKRAEEALRASEERYRRLFEGDLAGVYFSTPSGELISCNAAFARIFRFKSVDDALATDTHELYSNPEARQLFLQSVRQNRRLELQESWLKRRDGTDMHVIENVQGVFDDQGELIEIQGYLLDDTDRKRAEESVQESEERFRMVFENVLDGISIYEEDPDPSKRKLVACNDRYAVMAGRSREELLHQGITHGLHRTLENGANNNRLESLAEGRAYRGTFTWIRPDRKDNIIEYVGVPITWRGRLCSIGIDRDITERKRAEQIVRESEERFRELFNSMSSGVAVYEAIDGGGDFILKDFNPAAERIENVRRKDILGKRVTEVFPGVKAFGVFEVFQRVWRTGKPEYFPESIYRDAKDSGSWRESWVLKLPAGEILAIYNDITERKRAKEALRESGERYRLLLDNAGLGVAYWDVNGKLLFFNEKALSYMRGGALDYIGRSVCELYGKHLGGVLMDRLRKAAASEKSEGYEDMVSLPTGVRWFHSTYSAVRDVNRGVIGVQVISDDITERKRGEVEVQQKTEDMSLLNALNAAANRGESIQKIISLLAERTKKIFSSTGATVYFPSEDKECVIMQNLTIPEAYVHRIEQLIGMSIPQVRIALTEESIYRQILHEGKPRITNDPETIQRMIAEYTADKTLKKFVPAIYKILGIRTIITAPIIANNECIGMMDISRTVPFEESDLERMRTIVEEFSAVLQRKRTEDALRAAKHRLTNLSHRLLETQENERRAVARELHDEIGQILTASKIDLQVIRRDQSSNDFADRLDDNIAMLNECLQRVRDLSLDLRPSILDDLGIVAALRWQLERLQQRAGFQGHLTVEHIPERLGPDVETACFRVAREALTNIAKHAKAHNVEMNLTFSDEELVLSIQDDGIGFDSAKALEEATHGKSFGVLGMQERVALLGGKFELNSSVGKGTIVDVRLPLRVPNKQQHDHQNGGI